MGQETNTTDLTKRGIVYQIPGMDFVTVRRDVVYRSSEQDEQTLDVYSPSGAESDARHPAVVFVSGYRDAGMQRFLGCRMKEMASYISWSQLVAASGMVAITYTTDDPATDVHDVLHYLRQNAASLGIDEARIGIWAASGNVPNALSVLMRETAGDVKCAVLYYGLMLDLDGTTDVADASRLFGFVNPNEGKTIADLPSDLPLLIVRAGKDEMPHLNETIDRFLKHAVAANLPVTFINHPTAPHFFDALHDSETTREIIRQSLSFLRFHFLTHG